MEQQPRLTKTWQAAAYDKANGEWVHTELKAFDHTSTTDPAEVYTQAVPARITPSKRKLPNREHKMLFVFSDAQIGYRRLPNGELRALHDERALAIARLICRDLQPDEIVNLGDTIDLAELSRFDPDSDHFHRTIGPAFQRVHDLYAQLRADNPHAKITEVDSNHNERLKKHILKNAPQLYGMQRPGEDDFPMFTYPYMANLKPVDVNWVSGGSESEYVYGEEYNTVPIVMKHGKIVSATGTARKESSANPDVHIVRGHSHRAESHWRTNRKGNYVGSFVVGVSCRTTGEVPSYHSSVDDHGNVVKYQEDWQSGAMIISDYGGRYNFDHLLFQQDGEDLVAFFNGKEYRASNG